MRWPVFWSSTEKKDEKGAPTPHTPGEVLDNVLGHAKSDNEQSSTLANWDWHAYVEPRSLISTVILTSSCIGLYRFYRSYLRRIPAVGNISPGFFRKRSVFGKVTSVGDGDNFRIYHTPGGWLAGWGWIRPIPVDKKLLKNNTIHIRLAGIDAPELAHFGRPSQPFSQEALDWLTSYLIGRRIRAYVYKADQYGRVVATVYVRQGLLRRDVGLQMLRSGLATVYEAKTGAEFGEGLEKKYRSAEWWAKTKRKGMWSGKKKEFESPREYKSRHASGSPIEEPPAVETKK